MGKAVIDKSNLFFWRNILLRDWVCQLGESRVERLRIELRIFPEPVTRQPRLPDFDNLLNLEPEQALGSRKCAAIGVPVDRCRARKLQSASLCKIGKDQADARVYFDIAQRVEHPIAAVIRDGKTGISVDSYKTRSASAMGGVCSALRMSARNEERVGMRDAFALRWG